jgi:sugar O-acyltransferase (sialic acid O-acetyltransferase NeuD family)
MDHLVILGAGNFAREVLWVAQSVIGDLDVIFAADIEPDGVALFGKTYRTISTWRFPQGSQFIVGVGDPKVKRTLVTKAVDAYLKPATTIIHPRAVIAPDAIIGRGGCIFPGAVVSYGTFLGDYVTLGFAAAVGHGSRVGNYCSLHTHAVIAGGVRLDDGSMVGVNAAVRDGVRIMAETTVGMGAAVVRDSTRAEQVLLGVPARPRIATNPTHPSRGAGE